MEVVEVDTESTPPSPPRFSVVPARNLAWSAAACAVTSRMSQPGLGPKDSTPTSSSASTTETATTIMSRTEPTYVTENAYNRDGQESAIRGEFGRRAASK
mgnify:CR=1 FL=1